MFDTIIRLITQPGPSSFINFTFLPKYAPYFVTGILNTLALEQYEAMGLADTTLSFELHAANIRRLGGQKPRGILSYGYLPLMRLRACPAQTDHGCQNCSGKNELVDRTGARFPLLCAEKQYTTLLNSIPLDLSDKPVSGVDFTTLWFSLETRTQCQQIIRRFQTGQPPAGDYTRGLYFRQLK